MTLTPIETQVETPIETPVQATTATASRCRVLLSSLAVLCLLGTGCSVDANALEHSEFPVSAAMPLALGAQPLTTRPVHDPQVILTNAGSEPRSLVQVGASVGTVQTIQISQGGSGTFAVLDQDGNDKTVAHMKDLQTHTFPTLSVTATLTVTGTKDNQRSVAVVVSNASASEADDALMNRQAAALTSGLNAKTAQLTTTTAGAVLGDEPVIGTGEQSGSVVLGFVDRNVLTLADPLPVVPIGVGATWSVTTIHHSGGLPATVTRSYQITSITSDGVRADVNRLVSYTPGTHANTTIRAGSSLTGEGEATWSRDAVLGIVSYNASGNISYDLGLGDRLRESIQHHVRSRTTRLDVPPEPEPAIAPTTAPTTTVLPTTTAPTTPATTATTTPLVAQPSTTYSDNERPSEPGAPIAIEQADDQITVVELEWSEANDNVGVHQYKIYRASGSWDPLDEHHQAEIVEAAELLDATTDATFTDEPGAGSHYYFIKAVDAAGNVSWRSGITKVDLR